MLESLNSVLIRINEIQKRFNPAKFNHIHGEKEAGGIGKNFNEILNDQINTGNKADENNSISKIKETAKEYSLKNGLPPSLVNAVIKVESDFNPNAVSNKGARGLMQLMPVVLRNLGISNPFNVEENIKGGVSILKQLLEKYDWDFKKALAAYNAGEKAVDKNNGIPPYKETMQYVEKVLNAYKQNIDLSE